jgi:hypothetical protein
MMSDAIIDTIFDDLVLIGFMTYAKSYSTPGMIFSKTALLADRLKKDKI